MYKSYAGIGSRECPTMYYNALVAISSVLAMSGYTLRSGGADGSDTACEEGCDKYNGAKEIYLPWWRFNDNKSNLILKDERAYEIASTYHPYWDRLGSGARKLQARNSHQVLGLDLNTPVEFVLCYTKNGLGSGGTGQALRIAKSMNIPVLDIGLYHSMTEISEAFKELVNVSK